MDIINNFMPQQFISALGWTIIHSIWQGLLIALLLAGVLYLLNTRISQIRYLASIGALLIFVSLSVRTFVEHYETSPGEKIQTAELQVADVQSLPQQIHVQIDKTTENDNELSAIRHIEYWLIKYFNNHLPLIVSVYLLGIVFLSLKLTGSFLYTQRLKHYRITEVSPEYNKLVKDLCKRLHLDKPIKLFESAIVKVPVTIGYLKPVILFPAGMLNGINYDQLEAILAHELAHIKRADYIINLFQSMVEVLFFFNPAVWWISSIIRDERENVCDDTAAAVNGKPLVLAKGLVYVGQFCNDEKSLAISSINNKNKLRGRIMRLTGKNKSTGIKNRVYAASLLLLVFVSFGFFACGSAADSSLIYEEKDNGNSTYSNIDKIKEDERRYVFYKLTDGKKTKWDVTVNGDEIKDLHKNDTQVPKEDYPLYDRMIKREIAEIEDDLYDLHYELSDLEDELAELKKDKQEKELKKDLLKLKSEFNKGFDKDEFEEDMNNLRDELDELKDCHWSFDFDSDEFREGMEELHEALENLDLDIEINFDSDEFSESMQDLSRKLSNIKIDIPEIDIDLSGLEALDSLSFGLDSLNLNLDGLKEHMKKFKSFMREFKSEIVADGLVDKYDDIDNLEFEDGDVYLNYEKVPDHLAKKYMELYKKHFGEYPGDNAFSINH